MFIGRLDPLTLIFSWEDIVTRDEQGLLDEADVVRFRVEEPGPLEIDGDFGVAGSLLLI